MESILVEIYARPKRRPIIPFRVKLKHRIMYKKTRAKRKMYMRRYVRRPIARIRSKVRSVVRKRLGKRAKRFRIVTR